MSLDTYFEKLLATFSGQVLQHLSQWRLKRSIFVSSILKVFPAFSKKMLTCWDSNRVRLDYETNTKSARLCNKSCKGVKIGRLISSVRRFFQNRLMPKFNIGKCRNNLLSKPIIQTYYIDLQTKVGGCVIVQALNELF